MAVKTVVVALPGGVTALVQAVDESADDDDLGGGQGATKVSAKELLDFGKVSEAIGGIAHSVHSAVAKVRPSKATVEFGMDVAIKNGDVTGLLFRGKAEAHLQITLEWTGATGAVEATSGSSPAPEPMPAPELTPPPDATA